MRCILVATDLTSQTHNALGRACRIAHEAGAELHIIHATPRDDASDDASTIRRRLHEEAGALANAPPLFELDLSMRVARGEPAAVILEEAARMKPDLVILGAHRAPRLRDAIFGTTASRVVSDAEQPVLIVRMDYHRRYARVMAAVDEDSERVLRLACGIASMGELYVVHAHGSATQGLFGYGDTLEDVRADQKARIGQVLESVSRGAQPRPEIHSIVEQGEVMSVLMHQCDKARPDLLVIATHGRHGLAKLLRPSVAETLLLACPSDILVMPARAEMEYGA
jgi:nucleotide-binding universal stress UspA family protein